MSPMRQVIVNICRSIKANVFDLEVEGILCKQRAS